MKKLLCILLSAASSAFAAGSYVGGNVGYLVDSEDVFIAGHLGVDLSKAETLLHGVEVEVGYAHQSDFGASADIIPVMLNYRFATKPLDKSVSFYAGAGAGASNVRIWGFGLSDDGWAFTAQAFTGVAFKATERVTLKAGVRYLWIDEVKLFNYPITVGDDVAVELGLGVRF